MRFIRTTFGILLAGIAVLLGVMAMRDFSSPYASSPEVPAAFAAMLGIGAVLLLRARKPKE